MGIPRQDHEVVWNALQDVFYRAREGKPLDGDEAVQRYFQELQERKLLTNGEIQQLNSL